VIDVESEVPTARGIDQNIDTCHCLRVVLSNLNQVIDEATYLRLKIIESFLDLVVLCCKAVRIVSYQKNSNDLNPQQNYADHMKKVMIVSEPSPEL